MSIKYKDDDNLRINPKPRSNCKYDPEYHPKRIIDLMTDGLSFVEVAADFGVHRSTVAAWAKDTRYPEFTEAVKLGRQLSEAWWMRTGRLGTTGQLARFNANSWFATMKCRFGGRWLADNKTQVEISESRKLTDKELNAKIAAIVDTSNEDEDGSE